MSKIRRRLCASATLSVLVCGVGFAEVQDKSDPPKADSKAGVAAYVGGTVITTQDVDAKALGTNIKLAQSLYEARVQALDRIIMERLLGQEAAARGITVDELIRERVAKKTKPVTDEDVETYYNANRARLRGRTLEQASGQIRTYLTSQHANEARRRLLAQLKEKAGVRITLEPPRVEVVIAANDPVRGPPGAKVTIVEYSDFQ